MMKLRRITIVSNAMIAFFLALPSCYEKVSFKNQTQDGADNLNGDADVDSDTDADAALDSDTDANTTQGSDTVSDSYTDTDSSVHWEEDPLSGQEEPLPEPGSCLPGIYKGKFDGSYRETHLFPPQIVDAGLPVEGDIAIELNRAARGTLFTVEDGDLDGFLYGFMPFRAKIKGELDCSTGVFFGEISDGTYSFSSGTLVSWMTFYYHFEGSLRSVYDKVEHTFIRGEWEVSGTVLEQVFSYADSDSETRETSESDENNGGNGPWDAQWSETL